MRVTNMMMSRSYLRNLNKSMTNLANSNQKMSSQRRFNKAYENVADANRALRVRAQLSDNEQSLTTIRDTGGEFAAAEDNLRAINSIMQNVNERMVQGMNGTIPESERIKIAREIGNLQDEVLQISNMRYNDNYLFGAAGNKDGSTPFTTAPNGDLLFNGTPVDNMVPGENANAGKIMIDDGTGTNTLKEIPYNQTNYIDVGLGFTVKDGALDTKTAVKGSTSGVEVFGFGKNADGIPNNLYSLLGRISKDMEGGDMAALGRDLEQVRVQSDSLLMNITDLGNRAMFLEQIGERVENDTLNLQEVQNTLEAVPIQEEVIYNKDFEMSWMVTLQMGAKILPASIFDFLR